MKDQQVTILEIILRQIFNDKCGKNINYLVRLITEMINWKRMNTLIKRGTKCYHGYVHQYLYIAAAERRQAMFLFAIW